MAPRGFRNTFRTPFDPASRRRLAAAAASFLIAASLLAPSTTHAAWSTEEIRQALERKWDQGIARDLPSAQGCYRAAVAAAEQGNDAEALRLLEASTQFDPLFPDAHFTAARLVVLHDPGRAVAEASEAFKILGRGYAWQRHILANFLTGFAVIWLVALLLAVAGIVIRHLPHLGHILRESLGAGASAAGRMGVAAIVLSPCAWGLGAVPTAALYAGLLSFRFGKREWLLVVLFLVSALALAGGTPLVAPWAGPPRLDEPSLLVDRSMTAGYDHDLSAALGAWQAADANEPLYPFALGTQARRGGDLDLAERELTRAAAMRPRTPWILTNLGNVQFAREEYDRARQSYEAAAALDPSAVEPHYNLAQVYTKQLLFSEATREQAKASALAFERVRDFSSITAPQLNRTVMDAAPPTKELWDLAQRHASARGLAALEGNAWLRIAASLQPGAPFALAFLPALFLLFGALGQIAGRRLPTSHCSNCQKIVCRRCVHRMQQRAFCTECFHSVRDLKSTEFTRLLLSKRDRSSARRRTVGQAIVTFALPGAGQMLRGAAISGFVAILILVTAALLVVAGGALVPSVDVIPVPGGEWRTRLPLLILFVITYAITVTRYFTATTAKASGLAGRSARRESPPEARARTGQG